jgi:hypothetical protein
MYTGQLSESCLQVVLLEALEDPRSNIAFLALFEDVSPLPMCRQFVLFIEEVVADRARFDL